MKKPGFTLIEILVGLTLVAMVFSVAGAVLFSALKSSRKAAAVAVAKTEGAYAIRSMSDMIRYAQKVTCDTADPRLKLQVDRTDQESVVYSFDSSTDPDKIASRSGTFAYDPGTIAVDLTSDKVAVSLTECGGNMFTCSDQDRVVEICFAVDSSTGVDVTDKARGTGGIVFQTQVAVANLAN